MNQEVDKLVEYISDAINKGYSIEEIKDLLIKNGYSKFTIDEAIIRIQGKSTKSFGKRVIKVFLIIFMALGILFFLLVAYEMIFNKNLTQEEIVNLAQDNVFYIETSCVSNVYIPNWEYNVILNNSNGVYYLNSFFIQNNSKDKISFTFNDSMMGFSFRGSSFLVNGKIITNAHVVDCSSIHYRFNFLCNIPIGVFYDYNSFKTLSQDQKDCLANLMFNFTGFNLDNMVIVSRDIAKEKYNRAYEDEYDLKDIIEYSFYRYIINNSNVIDHPYYYVFINNTNYILFEKKNIISTGSSFPEKDFAVLSKANTLSGGLKLADSRNVKIGQNIYIAGYPQAADLREDRLPTLTFTKGVVSSIKDNYENLTYLQTDAGANPGNSGGPVFNDKGEVIGITTAVSTETIGGNINYILPSNYISLNK